MPVKHFQNNFSSGEWSPRLDSRADLQKYQNACRYLENFIILPHGGVRGRGGLHYVAGAISDSRKSRLIPFEFNVEQAYVCEFGHEAIRFFMNHGQIQAVPTDINLLLHFNGADASQSFTDSGGTGHTITAHGTVQHDTDQHKFGSASCLFQADGDYLSISDHADFNYSGGIWAIDFWYRPSSKKDDRIIYYQQTNAANYIQVRQYLTGAEPLTRLTIEFKIVAASTTLVSLAGPTAGLSLNTWNHVAIVENGNDYSLYINGTLADSDSSASRPANYSGDILIGGNASNSLRGWLDEFTVWGIAKWTDDFTPPTTEYGISGDESPVELTTSPYQEADLAGIKKTQSADTMYLFHPSYAPRKLTRTSHVNWSLEEITFVDGPYRDEQTTPTITPSATTGDITLTASDNLFVAGHIGALWRIKHTTSWGYVQITDVDDPTHADATVLSALDGSGTAAAAHAEGAWSTYRGFPTAGIFHEERLWLARDLTVWGSKKGEGQQENFTPGTADDDPVSFTLNSDRVNLIRWLATARKLTVGTAGEEFRIQGDPYISATSIDVAADTSHGSADVSPLKVGGAVLFVQRAGRKLRELVYSYDVDSYVAPDLTVLAEHITDPKILELAYQQEPDSLVWAVRSDGVLLSLTYMRAEDIVGWDRHITDGEVESIAVIPNPDGSADELWAVVKRTIGTDVKRFIEYLDPDIFVDCGLTYSGAPITEVTGLDHLEGETVKIVGDGAVFDDAEVTGGAVTISSACSEIYVGLAYTPLMETMRPEVQVANGTSRAMPKSWGDLWVALLDTVGCMINDEEIPFRAGGDPLDEAIPPFTGDKKVNQTGWGDGRVRIEQTQPLPITVLAVFGDFELGGA